MATETLTDVDDTSLSDPSDSFVFPTKKRNISLKRPAAADFDSATVSSASQNSKYTHLRNLNPSSNHHPASAPPSACLILREDHKALPFNFFNSALPKWTALSYLIPSSLERNQKGTVIVGQIQTDKIIAFHAAPHHFILNKINYLIKVPQTHTPFIGEVVFDLVDIEERSILSLSEIQLMPLLTVSSSCATNAILSVKKLYPRKTLSESDSSYSSINSMRISVECSSAVPDRVFFENVSLRVFPFIIPPIRCFCCQRYGHGAISCRRSARCAKCSSLEHPTTACDASNELNCFACGPSSSHACSSVRCKFYKAALRIAAQVQCGNIPRDKASVYYASLYSNPKELPSAQPLVMPSPALPPQLFSPATYSKSSMKTWPNLTTNTASTLSSASVPVPSHHPPLNTDGNLTSAQKPKKNVQPLKLPPHMTPEYAEVLSGNLWFDSLGPCKPPAVVPGSPCLGSPPAVPSSPSATSRTPGSPVLTLLKSLLHQLLGWILSCLPTDSPTAAIFSTLLQSFSAALLSSS